MIAQDKANKAVIARRQAAIDAAQANAQPRRDAHDAAASSAAVGAVTPSATPATK